MGWDGGGGVNPTGTPRVPTGGATIALAVGQVGIRSTWLAGLWPGGGLAPLEFAGTLLVPVWIWWTGPFPTPRPNGQSIAM